MSWLRKNYRPSHGYDDDGKIVCVSISFIHPSVRACVLIDTTDPPPQYSHIEKTRVFGFRKHCKK